MPEGRSSSLHARIASGFPPLGPSLVVAAIVTSACGGGSETIAEFVSVPPTPIEFVSGAGDTVQAERGEILVPENRADPDSRSISLAYVRFPSTNPNPGSPIVYLAGGPGGSGIGTARGRRFPLFMALREIGDVIAFDQRGTGDSNHIPGCDTAETLALDRAPTIDAVVEMYRTAAAHCVEFWTGEGVDLAGYTTRASVRDLDALRRALEADQLSLWGISYGTHLAMAAVKDMGSRIDRVILASAEGLDQTVKQPARTDEYFDRLQVAINTDPILSAALPDARGMVRRLVTRLNENPVTITVPGEEGGESVEFVMGGLEVQLLLGFSIADPFGAVRTLMLLAAADEDEGSLDALGQLVYDNFRSESVSMNGMSEAMDVASGISDGALARFEEQTPTSLLGGVLNFPMPYLKDAFGDRDLGPEFREDPRSDVPTLLLTGTLDGRT